MKTTVKKSFLDIQNEEKWLNEQGENSLMLVGYHNGVYEFENVFPVKYQYKIDLPTYTGSRKKEYLDFLEQSGIYFVAEYGGRVYLKKNAADGPLDMYTGKEEINKQVNRRYTHFIGIGVSQFLLGICLLIQTLHFVQQRGVPFWITVVIDVGLLVSGFIFFVMGIRKHKKYAIPKEDRDIWE